MSKFVPPTVENDIPNGILIDKNIREVVRRHGMISPFIDRLECKGVVSYGLTSVGVDLRLANEFKLLRTMNEVMIDHPELLVVDGNGKPALPILDPKSPDERLYKKIITDRLVLPPGAAVLGRTVETLYMPRNVIATVIGKSTYARCFANVLVTPIEPGFMGTVVIEIANNTDMPLSIYANEGIAQFMFTKTDPVEVSYADRDGKYQGQTDVQIAIVKG